MSSPEMLAALGQRDAECPRGDFRVLEEQLVEIAHPVEQQASGFASLISRYCAIIGVGAAACAVFVSMSRAFARNS
jgi:hypothetical protein